MAKWFDFNAKLNECVDDSDEKIHMLFTSEQLDKILKYQDLVKEETVQDAIMTAIDIASNTYSEV